MPIPPVRVKQSTTTTGTGTLNLASAPSNCRSFQAHYGTSPAFVTYMISGPTFFELNYGIFDGGNPGTLTRNGTPLASSSAGALVSLPAGVADVFAVIGPGERPLIESTATTINLAAADVGSTIVWTGTAAGTVNIPTVVVCPPGSTFVVSNQGTANLVIDPSGFEQINGAASFTLRPGGTTTIVRVLSPPTPGWRTIDNGLIAGAAGGSLVTSTTPAAARTVLELTDPTAFRNAVINGAFDIDQRGVLPYTAPGGYFIDRFVYFAQGGSRTVSRVALTDADRAAIGDETFANALQITFAGGSASGDAELFETRLENVRRFAGKTVTVSFFARATGGAPFVSTEFVQNHGTGGSPTAPATGIGGSNRFQLSTTFQRFTATVSIPSVAGRTLGTNGNDHLGLLFWLSGNNASWGSRVPGIVPQTATIQVTGVQVEEGPRATPYEHRPRGVELSLCQRYFYRRGSAVSYPFRGANYSGASTFVSLGSIHPVTMRTSGIGVPTLVWEINDVVQPPANAFIAVNENSWFIIPTVPAGGFVDVTTIVFEAEL